MTGNSRISGQGNIEPVAILVIVNANSGELVSNQRPSTVQRVVRRLDLNGTVPPLEGTWASLFVNNRTAGQGMTLSYIPPEIVNGKPMAQLDPKEINRNTLIWKNALIVYVLGETPPFLYMENYIAKYWKTANKPETYLHEDGFFIVKFQYAEDRDGIGCAGPYTFNNRPIKMKTWEPDFDI